MLACDAVTSRASMPRVLSSGWRSCPGLHAELSLSTAPGCGKSTQLAAIITLCIAQDRPVLSTASRHEAVDACLKKVEVTIQRARIDRVIIRVFDASEDKLACKRVLRKDVDWRSASFRARSKWRPHLSVAF